MTRSALVCLLQLFFLIVVASLIDASNHIHQEQVDEHLLIQERITAWTKARLQHKQLTLKQAHNRISSLPQSPVYYTPERATIADQGSPATRIQKPGFQSKNSIKASDNTCKQAWNGGGTGAWYRVDTDCRSSHWHQTSIVYCLPDVIVTQEGSQDGVYVSLGVYNSESGEGADIGLLYVPSKNIWANYAASGKGWVNGEITVDPKVHPCIDVSVYTMDNNTLGMSVADFNSGSMIATQVIPGSMLEPKLNLNSDGRAIGFYRFDSIAQNKETLKSGTQLLRSRSFDWLLFNATVPGMLASNRWISQDTRGFPPGPCCTEQEKATIQVLSEDPWFSSLVSIRF